MSVYRVVIDSSKRTAGSLGMNNFSVNIGNVFAGRDLIDNRYMMCVENTSLIFYSTSSATYAASPTGPRYMLISSPNFNSSNEYDSLRGKEDNNVIQALQCYCTANAVTGVFGSNHDVPYVRKKHLGKTIYPNTFQNNGLLSFDLSVGGQVGVTPADCSTPNDTTCWGSDWTMTLVFFPVRNPPIERSLQSPPYYDYFKLWMFSNARSNYAASTPANLELPLSGYCTHGQMRPHLAQWFMAVEFMSPVFYSYGILPKSLSLTTTWASPSGYAATTLCTLNRSYRVSEQGHFGVRYSIRPTARDTIGIPAVPPDGLSVLKLQIRDSATGSIVNGALLSEWGCCLTYFRQYR